MTPWPWTCLLLTAVLLDGGTEANILRTFDQWNLTSDTAELARLQLTQGLQYAGGYAELSCAYLNNVFHHKHLESFPEAWLSTPTLMPNTSPYNERGLYMFSFKCETTDSNYYPIYIGITGRSYRLRMTSGHDVLKTLAANKLTVPKKCGSSIRQKIYWTLIPWKEAVTAKFIESVFLSSFNFALNREENPAYRETIHKLRPQTSGASGKAALNSVLPYYRNDINNFISNQNLP